MEQVEAGRGTMGRKRGVSDRMPYIEMVHIKEVVAIKRGQNGGILTSGYNFNHIEELLT